MKAIRLFGSAVFTLSLVLPAGAANWHDVDDPQSLRSLFSNKTFKGKDWMGRPIVDHYRSDGQASILWRGQRIPARWEVKGRDQVCVVWSVRGECYRMQRHASKAALYRRIDVANDMAIEYMVEEGVADF
jgi:hypothetical protein